MTNAFFMINRRYCEQYSDVLKLIKQAIQNHIIQEDY